MTRIPYRDSEDGLSEEQLGVFNHIKESRGSVIGVFAALMGSPKVAELVADYGKYMRFDSILSDHVRELTICTALAEYSAQFEWGYHEDFAGQAGISPEAIEAVKFKKDLDGVGELESELIEFGRELIRKKRISDSTYDAVKRRYSEQEVTEITALYGYYACVSSILNAFEVPADPGKTTLPEPN